MERLKALHQLLKNDMKPVKLTDPKIIKFMSKQGLEGSGMIKLLQRLANLYNGHAYRDLALPKNVKFGKILNKNIIDLVDKMEIRGDNFMRFLIEADHLDNIGETEMAKRYRNVVDKKGWMPKDYKLRVGAAEHGLPAAAGRSGLAPRDTLLRINTYLDNKVNLWKSQNFDTPIFKQGALLDQYNDLKTSPTFENEKQKKNSA